MIDRLRESTSDLGSDSDVREQHELFDLRSARGERITRLVMNTYETYAQMYAQRLKTRRGAARRSRGTV